MEHINEYTGATENCFEDGEFDDPIEDDEDEDRLQGVVATDSGRGDVVDSLDPFGTYEAVGPEEADDGGDAVSVTDLEPEVAVGPEPKIESDAALERQTRAEPRVREPGPGYVEIQDPGKVITYYAPPLETAELVPAERASRAVDEPRTSDVGREMGPGEMLIHERDSRAEKGTFGEVLTADEDPQINVIGGGYSERELAVYHTLVYDLGEIRAMQRAGRIRQDVSVVVANLGSFSEEPLLSQAAAPSLYGLEATDVVGPHGFLSRLPCNELADTIARAAAGGDEALRRTYALILSPVANAVSRDVFNPQTLKTEQLVGVHGQDTLTVLRDALSQICGGLVDKPYSCLTPLQRPAVDRALTKFFIQQKGNEIGDLMTFVDQLIRSRGIQPPEGFFVGRSIGMPDQKGPRLTVEMMSVTEAGAEQGQLLAHGLGSYVLATRPAIVVIQDADRIVLEPNQGSVAGLERLAQACETLGCRLYLSVGTLKDERIQRLVQRGAKAILPLSAPDAGVASGILGTGPGKRVESESVNVGGSEGDSRNSSSNKNFEGYQQWRTGRGTSSARDRSRGLSLGKTQNVKYGEVPVAEPGALSLIRRGFMAVFGSRGERHGMFSLRSLGRVGDCPPPDPREMQIDGHLAQLAARYGLNAFELPDRELRQLLDGNHPALPEGTGRLGQVPSEPRLPVAAELEPADPLVPLEPHGRLARLRADFGLDASYGPFRRGFSREFASALQLYAEIRGMSYPEFLRWIGVNV